MDIYRNSWNGFFFQGGLGRVFLLIGTKIMKILFFFFSILFKLFSLAHEQSFFFRESLLNFLPHETYTSDNMFPIN